MQKLFAQFRQLPLRVQQKVIGGIVLVLVLFALWHAYDSSTPEYALRVIDGIDTREDIKTCRTYMTDQGAKVIAFALDSQKGPSSAQKIVFLPRQIRGATCFFPFTQGADAGYFEFRHQGVWKFHDIVVTRHNGRDIDLSIAYAIDHPILAALKTADWGAVFENFLKGFFVGLSLRGN